MQKDKHQRLKKNCHELSSRKFKVKSDFILYNFKNFPNNGLYQQLQATKKKKKKFTTFTIKSMNTQFHI